MSVTHWTPPPPTPPPDDGPRAWSLAATFLALVLPIVWLPVLGALLGFAAWLWRGEDLAALLRLGALLGLAAGVLVSLGVLLSSSIFARAVHRPPVTPAAPVGHTITYAPFGHGQDVRIVPLNVQDRYVDKVNVQDLAAFCWRLQRIGGPKAHTLRQHLGVRLPSGAIIDADMWRALCKPLRSAGIIRGVAARKSGVLRTNDAAVMLAQLGLDASDPALWPAGDEDD